MVQGGNIFKISIRLYGPLAKYSCQTGLHEVMILSDRSLAQLTELVGVPNSSVGLIVVNGVKRESDYRLQENDEVKFFPYIAGG